MNLKIFFSEDSDLVEAESEMKEWRGDVLVMCETKLYLLEFITPNRLKQDYERLKACGCICTLDNVILTERVCKQRIIDTIVELCRTGYFNNRQTADLTRIFQSTFPELQDISNWIQVY